MSQDSGQTRRRFLTTSAAVGIAVSVAGCNGGSGGESTDEPETETSTPTPTPTPAPAYELAQQEYTLEEGDGQDPEYNDLAKPVTFEGSAGDTVQITQRSDAFDTYLVIEAPDGTVVAENDDGEGVSRFNSRLTTTLDQTGEYTIWAGSFAGDATGEFTLTLEEVSPDE